MNDYISRFTPSMMRPTELEALLVQRHALVNQLVEHVRESALTESKNHALLVGPRGIGKTYIISLVYHRIKAQADLKGKLRIGWLREEEWGVASFLDFLLRILQSLVVEYNDKELKKNVEALFEVQPRSAEHLASELLKQYIGKATLLILMENLDELFKGLGEDGQMRLRAFVQENPCLTFVASSPSLFAGVSLQTSPFYGFFRIRHLTGLELDEAIELLVNIANLQHDEELAAFIQSAVGRARIRAVHHLAGGNHRVYVVFSQFLTRTSLDELINPFFRTLDDLTPYYQSRLLYLSTQQQKIVSLLCDSRHPLTVKEIAQRAFITHQTASGQLKALKALGYVNSTIVGRESYYEISEPLMRLTLEAKKHRVEPIRLFIDFLRLWYSKAELNQRLLILSPEAKHEREYVIHALQEDDSMHSDAVVSACVKDCKAFVQEGDFLKALKAAEELVAVRGTGDDYYEQAHCLSHLGRWDEVISVLDKGIKVSPLPARGWSLRGRAWLRSKRLNEALRCFERAVEMEPTNDFIWANRGYVLKRLQRYEDALDSFDKAIQIRPDFVRHWFDRAETLQTLGKVEESTATIEKAIKLKPRSVGGLIDQANGLSELGRFTDALRILDKAQKLKPLSVNDWRLLYHRSLVLADMSRQTQALKAIRKAVKVAPDNSSNWLDIGVVLQRLGEFTEALECYNKAIKLSPKESHCWVHMAETLSMLGRQEEAMVSWNNAIELGDDSALTYYNRGVLSVSLAKWEEGFADLDMAFTRERKAFENGAEDFIIQTLFLRESPKKWSTLSNRLVSIYRKHRLLPLLGQGIVQCIPLFISPNVSEELINEWSNLWGDLRKQHRQLNLPIRLFNVALRFGKNNDQRVLLELPAELRSIVLAAIDNRVG